MECKKCGSKNCQAISEYVEIEKKPFSTSLLILIAIGILATMIGLILILSSCEGTEVEIPNTTGQGNIATKVVPAIADTATALIGKYFIITGVSVSILVAFIRIIQPYGHETKTKIVCLDCGSTLYEKLEISDEDKENMEKDI